MLFFSIRDINEGDNFLDLVFRGMLEWAEYLRLVAQESERHCSFTLEMTFYCAEKFVPKGKTPTEDSVSEELLSLGAEMIAGMIHFHCPHEEKVGSVLGLSRAEKIALRERGRVISKRLTELDPELSATLESIDSLTDEDFEQAPSGLLVPRSTSSRHTES